MRLQGLLRLDVWLAGIGSGICLLLLVTAPFGTATSGCWAGAALGLIAAVLLPTFYIGQLVNEWGVPQRVRLQRNWRALSPRMRVLSIALPLAAIGLFGLLDSLNQGSGLVEAEWQLHVAVAAGGLFVLSLFGIQAHALLAAPAVEAARRCPNDHPVALELDFCAVCGARMVAPRGRLGEFFNADVTVLSQDRLTRVVEWLALAGVLGAVLGMTIREANREFELEALWLGIGVLFGATFVLSILALARFQSERSRWAQLKLLWRAAPLGYWLATAAVGLTFVAYMTVGIPGIRGPQEGVPDLPLLGLLGFCGFFLEARGLRFVADAGLVRRCARDHAVGSGDVYCPECGVPIETSRRT